MLSSWVATLLGTRNIPLPMISPTMIAADDAVPSTRGSAAVLVRATQASTLPSCVVNNPPSGHR
jgi:hypothetical protein